MGCYSFIAWVLLLVHRCAVSGHRMFCSCGLRRYRSFSNICNKRFKLETAYNKLLSWLFLVMVYRTLYGDKYHIG